MLWGWLDVGVGAGTTLYLYYAGRNCVSVDVAMPCCVLLEGKVVWTSVPKGCAEYRIYVPSTFWALCTPLHGRFELQVDSQVYTVLLSARGTYLDSNHNVWSGGMLRSVTHDGVVAGQYAADEADTLQAAPGATWTAQLSPACDDAEDECSYNAVFVHKKGHTKKAVPVRLHMAANACALLWGDDGNIWRKKVPSYSFGDRALVLSVGVYAT
jgi:hypothetical protein